MRCIEVATRREVVVVTGASGYEATVVYHYTDEPKLRREVTREDFFLNGYYVASTAKEPPCHVR